MRLFKPATASQVDLGLTILRVVTGIIFAAHGAQKLFVYGIDGVTSGFAQMGIPMAALAAPAVALVELLGGIALVAGLLTRLAGVGLAITMLGALFFAHLQAGFFLPNGYEFVLALMASAATLAIAGGGRLSLDAQIAGRRGPAAR
jgi:putative oxidoreductase